MSENAPLTDADLAEIEAASIAYKAESSSAASHEDVDPYRCPTCDAACVVGPDGRVIQGSLMQCAEHGWVTPRFDRTRNQRAAYLSFRPNDCGCQADSGVYITHCDQHDPEQMAEYVPRLLAEVRRLQREYEALDERFTAYCRGDDD